MLADAMLKKIVLTSKAEAVQGTIHGRKWTSEEDDFLRRNLGWLTDSDAVTT
jgi:hypothetical protein